MEKKRLIIILVVVLLLVGVAAGLITWLVLRMVNRVSRTYDTIQLEGNGIGDAEQRAAFARFREGAHMFWWFFPSEADDHENRPIIMWLDGVVGLPPSLLANFGIVGPYDFDLNKRNDSWVSDYNLLFVDAPVGSGFSFMEGEEQAARSVNDNSEDLVRAVDSFITHHGRQYVNTPFYIHGSAYGAQMATHLALLLQQNIDRGRMRCNLQGIILGNPIISPALVTSKLGFYLEELGYIDDAGRSVIETLARDTLDLVEEESYTQAFQLWSGLEETVSDTAGAVAVNLHRIVDKLTRDTPAQKTRGECRECARYLNTPLPGSLDVSAFMDGVVAPALGIRSGVPYDSQKNVADAGLREQFMKPAQESIERILQDTRLNVWIYNGNLDAVSNTPGQLLWIESLEWSGAEQWAASPRLPVAVSGILEGYQRSWDKLHLYWINVAGHSAPIDSPVAMRHVLRLITDY